MGSPSGARSLKTQQRERPRPSRGALRRAAEGSNTRLAFPAREGGHFEHKLKLKQLSTRPSGRNDNHLHGEFDPGSGRTLAACLTHASGATKRASARGRAANG